MVEKSVRGEYTITQLRPIPEKLNEFLPLWNKRLVHEKLADEAREGTKSAKEADLPGLYNQIRVHEAEVQHCTAAMRPFQYEVGETETFENLVTTVGKNDLLDKYLLGSSYTQTIRMGLKGTGTAVAGDTQASHAGWLEQGLANAPTYSGSRKTVTMGSAASGVSTSPTQAFSITSSGTVFGCFINNGGSATIDNTSGILFSAGDFSGDSRAVVNLDTLNVVYTLTAT